VREENLLVREENLLVREENLLVSTAGINHIIYAQSKDW
jgi:hypothetical protein